MKTDITAPGVDILAAWSPMTSPSIDGDDTTIVKSIYILKQKTLPSFCHVASKAMSSACHVSVFFFFFNPSLINKYPLPHNNNNTINKLNTQYPLEKTNHLIN